MRKTLLGIGGFFLLLFLPPAPVMAQEVGFAIYPPVFQIEAEPPALIEQDLTLQNLGENEVEVMIELRPFRQDPQNNGQVRYLQTGDFGGADGLIRQKIEILEQGTPVTSLLLRPLEVKNLKLKIDLPEDQEKGDYYFSVVFISTLDDTPQQSVAQTPGGIATNVLLSIGPKGPTTGMIERFQAPFFINNGPVPFKTLIFNSSDHYINPTGTITIKNMFGQPVGRVDLLPVSILSDSSRYMPDSSASTSAELAVLPQITAQWPEKLLFGWYTAELEVDLSETGPRLTKNLRFIAFPLQFVLGFVFALIILLGIYVRVHKKLHR